MVGRGCGVALVFCSLMVAVRLMDKRIGRTRQGYVVPWNRHLGALAGLVFGLVLAFCGLCLADVFNKAYPESEAWWVRAARASYFRTWVESVNPADRLLVADSLKLIRSVKNNPKAMEKLKEQKEFQELMEHPAVQDVLADEELVADIREAAESNDIKLLMRIGSNEKIRRLLGDGELRKKTFSREMRAAVQKALDDSSGDGAKQPDRKETPE